MHEWLLFLADTRKDEKNAFGSDWKLSVGEALEQWRLVQRTVGQVSELKNWSDLLHSGSKPARGGPGGRAEHSSTFFNDGADQA